jgi:hypothetical protein
MLIRQIRKAIDQTIAVTPQSKINH